MIVVPVLITSCQVSEKLKTGPVIAHIITTRIAIINAYTPHGSHSNYGRKVI